MKKLTERKRLICFFVDTGIDKGIGTGIGTGRNVLNWKDFAAHIFTVRIWDD